MHSEDNKVPSVCLFPKLTSFSSSGKTSCSHESFSIFGRSVDVEVSVCLRLSSKLHLCRDTIHSLIRFFFSFSSSVHTLVHNKPNLSATPSRLFWHLFVTHSASLKRVSTRRNILGGVLNFWSFCAFFMSFIQMGWQYPAVSSAPSSGIVTFKKQASEATVLSFTILFLVCWKHETWDCWSWMKYANNYNAGHTHAQRPPIWFRKEKIIGYPRRYVLFLDISPDIHYTSSRFFRLLPILFVWQVRSIRTTIWKSFQMAHR